MSNAAQVIVLGEDSAHVGAIYRTLVDHFGVPAGRVRRLPVAAGRGDAKQFVLDDIPNQIKLLRRGPASATLVVILDGDSSSPNQRRRDVTETLVRAKIAPLDASERVLILVPCRNIETWREFARCATVDQDTEYKIGRRSRWSSDDYVLVACMLGEAQLPKQNPPLALAEARDLLRQFFA